MYGRSSATYAGAVSTEVNIIISSSSSSSSSLLCTTLRPTGRLPSLMAPSSSSASAQAATTSVQVALRIRPTTTADLSSIPTRFQRIVVNAVSSSSVTVEPSAAASSAGGATTASSAAMTKKQTFTFDQVHPPTATQHDLFTSTALPLISRFVDGFNCTILAYGQTSSGKTFTMTGVDLDANPADPSNNMGIIPRAVATIFSRAKHLKEERGSSWMYNIKGSFIEIYNEDLIDLLGDDGVRRTVQIREDKDGHIIWGGLREVGVKSSSEVMSLIRQGTSLRRTNETDMNAQSSRSHAIFSLTLTQKKYTGSGAPPRSSSPLPPGRSPSRLARPSSNMYSGAGSQRVSSPTSGSRPATPSFAVAMSRAGTRPSSSLGVHGPDGRSPDSDENGSGEWITIVSKFHFVDLAGSERLKRTAAAGERIKEGISINGGLLALGNVISALGDPARAKTGTHVPYRDSKLTRLLQDSLGGNAHTLMIACVSPTEWNAAETVNTLKYANRARNIKNRVVVNQKEEGWDDVEWLQGTVTRLRKELKVIKDSGGGGSGAGGVITGGSISAVGLGSGDQSDFVEGGVGGSNKRMLAQMTELQNNYEDLREKFTQRTEELMRLRRELAEKQRASNSGAIGGTARYEEIVGPVIEEYEKTISAMEAELNLNRAALRHTNDLVEEKEEELSAITERHAATEMYVEELRARVVKLSEREASTEAYIRDLEERIKNYDETSMTSNESMTDLKRELVRVKDTESYSSKYITELEARLAKADESILSLQQTVEQLENESERRRAEVESLQSRLDSLNKDGASWRTDLEERERKLRSLELKMEEWERRKDEASLDRERLNGIVEDVAQARRSIRLHPPTNGASDGAVTPQSDAESVASNDAEAQLASLQQTHAATLADLSSVTAKYRDALREISDLAAQIQEAKLSSPAIVEPVTPGDKGDSLTFRRRVSPRSRESTDHGKRLFFRQAASMESLHARSLSQSQSLSQELSLARSRKASISSHGTSDSISQPSTSQTSPHRPALSISLSSVAVSPTERSVSSLEKEIMRLQEVLKEREAEISSLEVSLAQSNAASQNLADEGGDLFDPSLTLSPKTKENFRALRHTMEVRPNGHSSPSDTGSAGDGDESLVRLNELMLSMAQKESVHKELVEDLTAQLTEVRRQHDDLTVLSRDQAMNMSNELGILRERHDENLAKLEEVQKHEGKLVAAIELAKAEHASNVEQLRRDHEEALRTKEAEIDAMLTRMKSEHESEVKTLRDQLSAASSDLERSHREHTEAFGKLQADHEEELRLRIQEVNDTLKRTREEHKQNLAKVASEHEAVLKAKEEESAAILSRTEEEYYDALTKLRESHEEAMEKQKAEAASTLTRVREEHAGELRMAEIARQGALSDTQSSQLEALQQLQNEHSAAIAKKEAALAEELEKLKSEHAEVLASKEEDYRSKLERMRSKHSSALALKDEEREILVEKMESEHKSTVTELKAGSASEVQRLSDLLAKAREEHAQSSLKATEDKENSIRALQEQHTSRIQEINQGHNDAVVKLAEEHKQALAGVEAKLAEERDQLSKSHAEEIASLKSSHQSSIAEVRSELIAAQEQHRADLAEARQQSEQLLSDEKERLSATIVQADRDFAVERDTLRKDHDLLTEQVKRLVAEREAFVISQAKQAEELSALRLQHDDVLQELETHKATSEDFRTSQESTRESHEQALQQKTTAINGLQSEITSIQNERDELANQVALLRAELDITRSEQEKLVEETSKRQSLAGELERHRSLIAEIQDDLQHVRDERDAIQAEKMRQDTVLKDLQEKLARGTPEGARTGSERSYSRLNNLPAMKPPPPTPPPSIPPPPIPKASPIADVPMTPNTFTAPSVSSHDSSSDTIHSSLNGPETINGRTTSVALDPALITKLEEQTKQIEEQETMINTLNKQLSHCENDLQTHMDLVATLEGQLGDSEKNLRKARMHATDLARERDSLSSQMTTLRNELQEAKSEVISVRQSVVEEKQSLQHRLDEERRAKERARQQLDSRMDELQKRKSKFACL